MEGVQLRGTFADRLMEAQRKQFVGRTAELELFRTLLTPDRAYPLLFIYGPGGVGKSSLLREFKQIGEIEGYRTLLLDGRDIDPSPPAFLGALQQAFELSESESPYTAFHRDSRFVLLLDTYEALFSLDVWIREQFLPQLPAQCLVIITGRLPPMPTWREAGWGDLMRVISLRNLDPSDSTAFLKTRGVPEIHYASVVTATHGHPLALSLVGDIVAQTPDVSTFDLNHVPDVVRVLLDRFVQQVPTPRHREALEIAAHARITTESLLQNISGTEDAYDLFAWLRSLSFIEYNPHGIFPHDLARDVLDTDLRWRNYQRYRKIHRQIRQFAVQQFQQGKGLHRQRAFFDLLYLHRHNPLMRPYFDWDGMGEVYADAVTPTDIPSILAIIERYEGKKQAQIAAYWINQQPQSVTVFRQRDKQVFGFAVNLLLSEPTSLQRMNDPAIEPVWNFIQRHAPLRGGEIFLLQRFWGGADAYQMNRAAHNLMAMLSNRLWLTIPKLSWAFPCILDPEHYQPMFTYLRFRRVPEADFMVSGTQTGVFAHDWRAESMSLWLEKMGERELKTEPLAEKMPVTPSIIVLSQAEFKEAVRHALRDFHNNTALATNSLLRSRLCFAQTPTPTTDTLQALIRSATSSLKQTPKDEKFYRALHYTYLEPLATQELVAERLDLPFSTYRYHLSNGIERVTEWLWQKELYR